MIPPALAARVEALGRENTGGVAAFDADGTLWREDVGEAFLRHLVSLGWVRLPDGSDPYQAYEREVDRDRESGYAYAAKLQAGLEVALLEDEAARFAASWVPPRRVGAVQGLRELCERSGLAPMVVSASALPIVLAAAPLAGFSRERCRGIEVRIRGGKFTSEVVEPVSYAEGKIAALRGAGPLVLACGDSYTGDLAMLQAAQVAVAVAPASGSPLAAEAARRSWFVLDQQS
ncbi:MAG TPA: haloacid dehalogenase-like hydrolase [Myxococcales bacterium]|nr:haloacid dehalogenase-like hydrolase [Myxococcales bacterium]